MSQTANPFVHPTMRDPRTGKPLEAIGVLKSGRIVWPIMGASPDDPSTPPARPEGISEDEWNALGDPGKAAIVREREARQEAERKLAAAQARPAPPKAPAAPAPAVPAAPSPGNGTEQDIAKIVNDAVAAAIKPFQEEREQQRLAEAAGKIQTAVLEAAKTVLQDESDAIANIDLTTVVNDQGQADPAKIQDALKTLVEKKPHLAKSPIRIAPPGIGGGLPAATTEADKVKAALEHMQRSTGVRLPTSN